jgi:transcriptional regulator with XRE-family HTH domain
VDDIRLGGVVRALRIRRGWNQEDLARVARVSPSTISRVERGRIDRMDVAVLRRVFTGLDARIDLVPRWHGGDLDRLVDARHAGMVETLVRRLSSLPEWVVHPEVTFSIFGERGSIDIIAWHPRLRALLIIEVKSAIGDVGGLVRQVDRYRRLAREVARERGWLPSSVAVWVVVADGRTARRRLAEHHSTLRSAFPADGHTMERWLHAPGEGVRALSFLPFGHPAKARRHRNDAT